MTRCAAAELRDVKGEHVAFRGTSVPASDLLRSAWRDVRARENRVQDHEDLVQEALWLLLQYAHEIESPFAYLQTVVRRLVAQRSRNRSRRELTEQPFVDESGSETDCETAMVARVDLGRLLGRLELEEREFLIRATAGIDGCGVQAAWRAKTPAERVRLHRLRQRMKKLM